VHKSHFAYNGGLKWQYTWFGMVDDTNEEINDYTKGFAVPIPSLLAQLLVI